MVHTGLMQAGSLTPGRRPRWSVTASADLAAIGHRWRAIEAHGATTPFQSREWLESWYNGAADRGEQPVIVTADDADGRTALLMPLVRCQEDGLAVLGFADAGISDYNAPALGPGAPLSRREMASLWRAIRRVLPAVDTIRFEKMPATICGRPNPLLWLPGVGLSSQTQSACHLTASIDETRARLMPFEFRETLDNRLGKLKRKASVRFELARTHKEAVTAFDALVSQRAERAAAMGWGNVLDASIWRQHYLALVLAGLDGGMTRLLALYVDDVPVATILGFLVRDRFYDVLTSFDMKAWKRHSLGLLVLDQALGWMAAQGVKIYDLTIGAESYKHDFGPTVLPLYELVMAGSMRGVSAMAKARLKGQLRRSPAALRLAKRLAGRKD